MDGNEHAMMREPELAPAAAPAAGPAPEPIAAAVAALDFGVHVSQRYHAKRLAWFDGLHRLATVISAVGSGTALAALLGGLSDAAAEILVAVVLAAALELIFALAYRARTADMLHRRFGALATEIAEADAADADRLRGWEKRRLLIRADAEERLLVLHRICYNLEAEARGYPDAALYAVMPWQRLAAHLVSLPPYRPRRCAG